MPYLGRSPGSGVRSRFIYAATSGQTSFSGNDSAGISLAYEDTLYMDVYQNGVLLKPVTDYTSTTGTSVVLATGATTDDVVEMIVYDTFAVADTVSAKDGGSFGGSIAVAGNVTATGTVEPAGDTAAGDNAAIGFTSAEGLILTGQGSSSDITVKNDADATVFSVPTGQQKILFPDNARAMFGDSSDLQIYHDASDSYINDTGTGNLRLAGSANVEIISSGGEFMAKFVADGASTLYHNNVAKIATASTGVDITGAFTATDGSTITTADNTTQLTLKSTDADGSLGPKLDLTRDSSSPANGDNCGQINFNIDNDAGESTQYGDIFVGATAVADGSESAHMTFSTMKGGTRNSRMKLHSDETVFNEDSVDVDFRVESNGNAQMLTVNAGDDNIGIGRHPSTGVVDLLCAGSTANQAIRIADSTPTEYFGVFNANSGGNVPNAANATLKVRGMASTDRSINAGGTVNASGNDYAEYMTKADGVGTIAKGAMCGVDSDGKLTDVFANAHSFVIKSTDPSYVGGDVWSIASTDSDGNQTTLEGDALETARQKVDRIAFSGQVPCTISGTTKVGDFVVAQATSDGGIEAVAVTSPTFEQYSVAVGKVWKLGSSQHTVAVKIGQGKEMSRAQEIADLLAGVTITTADNNPQITLTSTDTDAGHGPRLNMVRNPGEAGADGDNLGQIFIQGYNDAGTPELIDYFQLFTEIADASDGTEDARQIHYVMTGGSQRSRIEHNATETVINEDSVDVDFRVESDEHGHAFFVDGEDGNISMGLDAVTVDSSLAGVSVPSGSRIFNINDADGAYLKLTDPSSGSNRGAQFAIIGTDAILNNCEGGSFKFGNGNTLAMTLNSSRALGIGKTPDASVSTAGTEIEQNGKIIMSRAAACPLFINRSNDGVIVQFSNSGSTAGTISVASGPSTAYNTSSDYRLKENVDYTWDATTRFKQLKPARFNFIGNADTTVDGFLAHEVSSIVPEAITGTKDETRSVSNAILSASGALLFENITQDEWTSGKLATKDVEGNDVDALYPSNSTWTANHTEPVMQGIDQSKLVPLLVKTIQELESRITALEAG